MTSGHRTSSLFLVCTFLLFVPVSVHAAVLINEVAWMGTTKDPNGSYCEWIELYNDDTPVSLDGWTLSFGDVVIELSSSMAEGAYYVIERYTENACPDPILGQSDLSVSFGNGLSNAGVTLILTRAGNGVEDEVVGGENWEKIGGDNETKDTAQRSPSGWITAVPTPGKQNVAMASVTSVKEENNKKEDGKDDTVKPERISLVMPDNELSIDLGGDRIAYVNQPIYFEASPHGLGEHIMDSLSYVWSFGDATTQKKGKKVSHIYRYPGEYVVVADASYSRHESSNRIAMTVLPTTLRLGQHQSGDLLIQNTAQYEIDISGFLIRANGETFRIPTRTILLPNTTLRIPYLEFGNTVPIRANAYDAAGEHLALLEKAMPEEESEVEADDMLLSAESQDELSENEAQAAPAGSAADETREAEADIASEEANVAGIPGQEASVINANLEDMPKNYKDQWPILVLISIISIGVLALYAGRLGGR